MYACILYLGIDEACCTKPDIFIFDVNCATKKSRWTSSRYPLFGFCYYYKCSADDNVNYCSGLDQVNT